MQNFFELGSCSSEWYVQGIVTYILLSVSQGQRCMMHVVQRVATRGTCIGRYDINDHISDFYMSLIALGHTPILGGMAMNAHAYPMAYTQLLKKNMTEFSKIK